MWIRFCSVFGLPPDVVDATLGDIGIEEVERIATGVSHIRNPLLLLVITSYFPLRSQTVLHSELKVVSRSVISREVNRARTNSSPGMAGMPSPINSDEELDSGHSHLVI